MGQAKKRGTFEQRKADAIVREQTARTLEMMRRQEEQAERERKRAERETQEREYQEGRRRHRPTSQRISNAALLAVAMLGTTSIVPERRK